MTFMGNVGIPGLNMSVEYGVGEHRLVRKDEMVFYHVIYTFRKKNGRGLLVDVKKKAPEG